MKISELINNLETLKEMHGDMCVTCRDTAADFQGLDGFVIPVFEAEIISAQEVSSIFDESIFTEKLVLLR